VSTSNQVYEEIRQEGLIGKLQLQILGALMFASEPLTTGEISKQICCDQRNTSSPRMAELVRLGCIKKAGYRRCRVSKRSSYVWEFTGQKPVKPLRSEAVCCPTCRGSGKVIRDPEPSCPADPVQATLL